MRGSCGRIGATALQYQPRSLPLLLLAATCHLSAAGDDGSLVNVLMVGNSYTAPVAPLVRGLLNEALAGTNDTLHLLLPLTAGGARLSGWATNANLRDALLDNSTANYKEWDYVVLQDQSQVPGFQMPSSVEAVVAIDEMIEQNGATTVLYQTWGRENGDSMNPGLYPDFETMNQRLREGYFLYRDATSTPERPVLIAPVGSAFEEVYNSAVPDPTGATRNRFPQLYAGDGSHASTMGSYLAALVIAQTITGMDPRERSWRPDGMGDADAAAMREFAWQATEEFAGEQHTRRPTVVPTASPAALPSASPTETSEPTQSPQAAAESAGAISESAETPLSGVRRGRASPLRSVIPLSLVYVAANTRYLAF